MRSGTAGDTAWWLEPGPGGVAPVVLIHGVGLDHGMWDGLRTQLAGAAPLLRYDLLGHGASGDPPGPRTLADFTGQVTALLDHLGIRQAILAGFSLGALVALGTAVAHAERVSGLVVMNAVFERDEAARAAVLARCEQVARHGAAANLDAALERWFTPAFRSRRPEVVARVRALFAAHRDDGYLKAYRVFAGADRALSRAALSRIGCPTRVVTAEDDANSTPAMARLLSTLVPGAGCSVIGGGQRHMAPVEVPADYAAAIRSLLDAP